MDFSKHDKICDLYWDIRARVQHDPEYARIFAALEELMPQYEAILKTLDDETQAVIERYILIRESMNSRMLEWACKEMLLRET